MAQFTDKEMETEVGLMLRVGVTLSAAVVLIGGLLYLNGATEGPKGGAPNYTHFHAMPQHLRSIPGTLQGVLHFDPASIIQLGILLLIATPVARVAFCVVGFARQRNKLYVGVSALVLAILIYSLAAGGR